MPTGASAILRSKGREAIRGHLIDQYQHHFHLTVSIFKGITLGAAAFSLISIFGAGAQVSPAVQLTAFSFWLASFITMIATYDAMMVHSLITVAPPNVIDVMAPFILGIAEFLLFPLANPVFWSTGSAAAITSATGLRNLAWWPLGMTATSIVGSLFMANSQGSLSRTRVELPPEFDPFITFFKTEMRRNQFGTAFGAVFNFSAFLVLRYGFPFFDHPRAPAIRHWEGLLGLPVILSMFFAILSLERTRQRFIAALTEDEMGASLRPPDDADADDADADDADAETDLVDVTADSEP